MFTLKTLIQRPLLVTQRNLANRRTSMKRERFIEEIASTALGRSAAELLWDKLTELVIWDDYTPYPHDDLLRTFGLAEEDLDEDVIFEILQATGSRIPSQTALTEFGPVNTPADIIRLIEVSNIEVSNRD